MVYYVPISTNNIPTKTDPMKPTAVQSAFSFSPTDLPDNAAGRPSDDQLRSLHSRHRREGWLGYTLLLGAVLLIGAEFYLQIRAVGSQSGDYWSGFYNGGGYVIGGLLVLLGSALFLEWRNRPRRRDLEDTRIDASCGKVDADRPDALQLANGTSVSLNSAQRRALTPYDNQSVRVFYLPHSRKIASVDVENGCSE